MNKKEVIKYLEELKSKINLQFAEAIENENVCKTDEFERLCSWKLERIDSTITNIKLYAD